MKSALEKIRGGYLPPLSSGMRQVQQFSIAPGKVVGQRGFLQEHFPHLISQPILQIVPGDKESIPTPLKVGVLLSGGQAPGGHNVICALFDALQLWHKESILIGFLGGAKGLIDHKSIRITKELVDKYRNSGGFDMIGSGRTKIESEVQLKAAAQNCLAEALDGLVIIGGDDSNTNAAVLAEAFIKQKLSTKVIGIPKTIDGDLKNNYIECSFGFDTATKIYSEMIGNLARDAVSSKKYMHFVKLMGRSASHVTLECALQTQPNLVFIGEEVEASDWTLEELVGQIADVVEERSQAGKSYGVIVIPEGLIEFIPQCKKLIRELNAKIAEGKEEVVSSLSDESRELFSFLPQTIAQQLLYDRDSHGNVRLSQIDTEKLLIELTERVLQKRHFKGAFAPLAHFFGYEGRSGLPSNFDANYCYALGFCAFGLIKNGCTGYMAAIQHLTKAVQEWEMLGIPLVEFMHMEERGGRMQCLIAKKLVDLEGKPFLKYKELREGWRLSDDYMSPGPIQFSGPTADITNLTLQLEY